MENISISLHLKIRYSTCFFLKYYRNSQVPKAQVSSERNFSCMYIVVISYVQVIFTGQGERSILFSSLPLMMTKTRYVGGSV